MDSRIVTEPRARFILISIASLLLFRCCNPPEPALVFRDPYADSFRDRNIKWMIGCYSGDSSYHDTTFFDKEGDAVRYVAMMTDTRRQFDKNHFIVRQLQLSDAWVNILIEYSVDAKGILYQKWWALKRSAGHEPHQEWAYDSTDREELLRTVKFIFDKGLLVEEIDTKDSLSTIYKYEGDRLVSQESFGKSGEHGLFSSFLYDDRGLIKRITFSHPEFKIDTQYFTNGLLDSVVGIRGKVNYRYSYY